MAAVPYVELRIEHGGFYKELVQHHDDKISWLRRVVREESLLECPMLDYMQRERARPR